MPPTGRKLNSKTQCAPHSPISSNTSVHRLNTDVFDVNIYTEDICDATVPYRWKCVRWKWSIHSLLVGISMCLRAAGKALGSESGVCGSFPTKIGTLYDSLRKRTIKMPFDVGTCFQISLAVVDSRRGYVTKTLSSHKKLYSMWCS